MKKIIVYLVVFLMISPIFAYATPINTVLTRTLLLGMMGTDVTFLQNYLIKLGILKTEATGYFGNATFIAVKEFQRQNNMPIAGVAGPITRGLINSIILDTLVDQTNTTVSKTQTTTDLQTKINSLMAIIKQLQTQLSAMTKTEMINTSIQQTSESIQTISVKDCGSVSNNSLLITPPSIAEQENYSCFIFTASLCNPTKISFTGENPGSLEVNGKDGNYCSFKFISHPISLHTCKLSLNDLSWYAKPTSSVGTVNGVDDTPTNRAISLIINIAFGTVGSGGTNSVTGKPIDMSCIKN